MEKSEVDVGSASFRSPVSVWLSLLSVTLGGWGTGTGFEMRYVSHTASTFAHPLGCAKQSSLRV